MAGQLQLNHSQIGKTIQVSSVVKSVNKSFVL